MHRNGTSQCDEWERTEWTNCKHFSSSTERALNRRRTENENVQCVHIVRQYTDAMEKWVFFSRFLFSLRVDFFPSCVYPLIHLLCYLMPLSFLSRFCHSSTRFDLILLIWPVFACALFFSNVPFSSISFSRSLRFLILPFFPFSLPKILCKYMDRLIQSVVVFFSSIRHFKLTQFFLPCYKNNTILK